MKIIAVALLLCGPLAPGVLLCFSQSSSNRQQEIESHARKAAEFLKENKPELAAPEFKAIVALDPKNVDARGNLGVMLFFQGEYAGAIPQLRGALQLRPSLVNPNSARMHQAMAHELAKRGAFEEAIKNYREALKIDPQLPGLHFELAEMLGTLSTAGGREEAEKEYKAAVVANPLDEQSESRLGDIALQKDDVKEANERYIRAIQIRPGDPEASIGLAKVFIAMDQPEKAEPLLLRALQLDPTSALAHFRLATLYRQAGRNADAKRELEEYQKYKKMKEDLRDIYHNMGVTPEKQEGAEADARQ